GDGWASGSATERGSASPTGDSVDTELLQQVWGERREPEPGTVGHVGAAAGCCWRLVEDELASLPPRPVVLHSAAVRDARMEVDVVVWEGSSVRERQVEGARERSDLGAGRVPAGVCHVGLYDVDCSGFDQSAVVVEMAFELAGGDRDGGALAQVPQEMDV